MTGLFTVTMNTQSHATLKATPYEVVFGLKPSSKPVQDLIITEENTDDDSGHSEDNEHDPPNVSFGCGIKTGDQKNFPLLSSITYANICTYIAPIGNGKETKNDGTDTGIFIEGVYFIES